MAGGTALANLRVTIDGKSAEAGMRSLAQGSDKLARSLLGVNSAARTLGNMSLAKVFAGLSVGYLTYELYGMSKQILEIGNQFQGLKVAMESAVGNKSRAAQEMKFVKEEANRLGVNVLKSVDAFTKLAASTRETALEGEMTRRAFTAIAQAARALSLSSEQQYGAFVAIYQIASKAKVSMEELRQQLGDRLPGAMNIAARAMGMTTNDFYEFVAAGKLASTDFLPKFIAELEKLYTAGAQAAAKLPTAELERLTNTLYEMANALYEMGVGEAFAQLFRDLNAALKAVSFTDLKNTAEAFATVLSAVGSIVVFLAQHLDELFKILLAIFAGKIFAGIGNMVSGFLAWRKGIIAVREETQALKISAEAQWRTQQDALEQALETQKRLRREAGEALTSAMGDRANYQPQIAALQESIALEKERLKQAQDSKKYYTDMIKDNRMLMKEERLSLSERKLMFQDIINLRKNELALLDNYRQAMDKLSKTGDIAGIFKDAGVDINTASDAVKSLADSTEKARQRADALSKDYAEFLKVSQEPEKYVAALTDELTKSRNAADGLLQSHENINKTINRTTTEIGALSSEIEMLERNQRNMQAALQEFGPEASDRLKQTYAETGRLIEDAKSRLDALIQSEQTLLQQRIDLNHEFLSASESYSDSYSKAIPEIQRVIDLQNEGNQLKQQEIRLNERLSQLVEDIGQKAARGRPEDISGLAESERLMTEYSQQLDDIKKKQQNNAISFKKAYEDAVTGIMQTTTDNMANMSSTLKASFAEYRTFLNQLITEMQTPLMKDVMEKYGLKEQITNVTSELQKLQSDATNTFNDIQRGTLDAEQAARRYQDTIDTLKERINGMESDLKAMEKAGSDSYQKLQQATENLKRANQEFAKQTESTNQAWARFEQAAKRAQVAAVSVGRSIANAAIGFVNFTGIVGGLIAGFYLFKNVLLDWRSELTKSLDEYAEKMQKARLTNEDVADSYEETEKRLNRALAVMRNMAAAYAEAAKAQKQWIDTSELDIGMTGMTAPLTQEQQAIIKLWKDAKQEAEFYQKQLDMLRAAYEKVKKAAEDLKKEEEMRKTTEGQLVLLSRKIAELEQARYAETNPARRDAIASEQRLNDLYKDRTKLLAESNAKLQDMMDYTEIDQQINDAYEAIDKLFKKINVETQLGDNGRYFLDETALARIDEYIESLNTAKKVIEETKQQRGWITDTEIASLANLDQQIALLESAKKLYDAGLTDQKEFVAQLQAIKALRKEDKTYIEQQNERLQKQLETIRDINKALKEQVEDRQRTLQVEQQRMAIIEQIAILALQEPVDLGAIDRLQQQLRDLEAATETQNTIIENNRRVEQSFGNLEGAASQSLGSVSGNLRILLAATDQYATVSGEAFNTVADAINNIPDTIRQVSPDIVMAIGIVESQLKRTAVSPKGAVGIFQFMPDTLAQIKKETGMYADTVEQDVLRVMYWLKKLYALYGDWDKAIAAHNMSGENAGAFFKQWGDAWREHLPEETKNFLTNVKNIIPVLQAMSQESAASSESISGLTDSMGEGDAELVEYATSVNYARDALADLQTLAGVGVDTSAIEELYNISKKMAELQAPRDLEEKQRLRNEYDAQRLIVNQEIYALQQKISAEQQKGINVDNLLIELSAKEKLLEITDATYQLSLAKTAQEKLAAVEALLAAKGINVQLKAQEEIYKANVSTLEELRQSLEDINREIQQSDLEFQLDWAEMTGASAEEFARLRIEIFRTTEDYQRWINTVKTGSPDAAKGAQEMIDKTEQMIRTSASRDRFLDAMSGISQAWDDVWDAMIDETKSFTEFLSDFLKQWAYKLAGDLLKTKIVLPIAGEIIGPFFGQGKSGENTGVEQVVDAANKTTDAVNSVGKTAASVGGGLFNLLSGLFQGTWQFLAAIITALTTGSMAQAGDKMAQAGQSFTGGMSDLTKLFSKGAWSFGGAAPADAAFNARFAARTGTAVPGGGGGQIGAGYYGVAGIAGYYGANALYKGKGYSGMGGGLGAMGGMKLGAMYGSTFGPMGTVVGAVIGAIAGAVAGGALGSMFGGEKIKGGVGYYDFNKRRAGAAHGDTDPAVVEMMQTLGSTMEGLDKALRAIEGFGDMWNFGAAFQLDTDSAGRMDAAYNSYSRGLQKASFKAAEDAAKWFVEQMVQDVQKQFELHAADMGGLGDAITNIFKGLDAEQLEAELGNLAAALPAIMESFADLSQPLQAEVADIARWHAKSLDDISALMMMAKDVQEGYATSLWEVYQVTKEVQDSGETLTAAYQRVVLQFRALQDAYLMLHGELLPVTKDTLLWGDALAEAAGGLDQLTALQGYYFENYYTETERLAAAQKRAQEDVNKFNATLGLTGDAAIDTRSELRKYIESLDISTASGQEAYIAALKLAEAIGLLDPVMEDTAASIAEIIKELFGITDELGEMTGRKQGDNPLETYWQGGGNMLDQYLEQLLKPSDDLRSQTQRFFEEFYTPAEVAAAKQKAWNKQINDFNSVLGLSGDAAIDTKEELRKYIESLDLTTEAGQKAYAEAMKLVEALLGLADAERNLTDELNETMAGVRSKLAGDAYSGVEKDLRSALGALEDQYKDLWEQVKDLGGGEKELHEIRAAAALDMRDLIAQTLQSGDVQQIWDMAKALYDNRDALQEWLLSLGYTTDQVAQYFDWLIQNLSQSLKAGLTDALNAAIQKAADLRIAFEKARLDFISRRESIGGGGINPNEIWGAGERMYRTYEKNWGGMDLESRLAAVQDMLGMVDQWVSASEAAIDRALRSQIDAINAAADAQIEALNNQTDALEKQRDQIQENYQAQMDALQETLDGLEEWISLAESLNDTIQNLQYSTANPLPTTAQMAAMTAEIERLYAQLGTAPADERAGIVQQLQDLLTRRLQMAQDVFQRPDPRYQELYTETMRMLTELQGQAQEKADQALAIQDEMKRLQEEMDTTLKSIDEQIEAVRDAAEGQISAINAARDAQIKAAEAAAQSQKDAIYATAKSLYDQFGAIGEQVYQEMIKQADEQVNVAKEQLNTLLKILWQIQTGGAPYPELEQNDPMGTGAGGGGLRRKNGIGGVPSYQSGIDFVPRDGYAYLHRGEKVTPAGESDNITIRLGDIHIHGDVTDPNKLKVIITKQVNDMIPYIKRKLPRS